MPNSYFHRLLKILESGVFPFDVLTGSRGALLIRTIFQILRQHCPKVLTWVEVYVVKGAQVPVYPPIV